MKLGGRKGKRSGTEVHGGVMVCFCEVVACVRMYESLCVHKNSSSLSARCTGIGCEIVHARSGC